MGKGRDGKGTQGPSWDSGKDGIEYVIGDLIPHHWKECLGCLGEWAPRLRSVRDRGHFQVLGYESFEEYVSDRIGCGMELIEAIFAAQDRNDI